MKDRHKPDLATFARICAALAVPPGVLLGDGGGHSGPGVPAAARVTAAMAGLDAEAVGILAAVAEGLVATAGARRGMERSDDASPASANYRPVE